jgi:hypothetical protein
MTCSSGRSGARWRPSPSNPTCQQKPGDSEEALGLLAQALVVDSDNEVGWLRFVAATDDPGEKRYARDHAVSVIPDSIGVASRNRMLGVTPVMLNELTEQRDARLSAEEPAAVGVAHASDLFVALLRGRSGSGAGRVRDKLDPNRVRAAGEHNRAHGRRVHRAHRGALFASTALSAAFVFINIAVERLYKE